MLYSLQMETLGNILPYIQVALALLLIAGILMQQSSSGLGGAFGESNNFGSGFHSRRGAEQVIFLSTIIAGVLFVVSSILIVAIS